MLAALTFSGLNWLLPAAIIGVAALLVIAWSYAAGANGAVRWVCAALKTLGIATLGFCLLEPLWTGQRAKPGANLFAIVADNSAGLQIKDAGEKQSRGELLKRLLNPETGKWQGTLADNFELRRFSFDSRLNAVRDFSELNFTGRASAIGSALRGPERAFSRASASGGAAAHGRQCDGHSRIPAGDERIATSLSRGDRPTGRRQGRFHRADTREPDGVRKRPGVRAGECRRQWLGRQERDRGTARREREDT